mgnify:CR=1 FL=1
MRKKGFTLVELIGVILILGIILILATPVIKKINSNSRQELYDIQIVNIIDALKLWSVDNSRVLPQNEGETITITLGQLKMGGYIDEDLKNPQTNTCFGNDMLLTVSRYRENYIYDVKEDSDTESDSCSDYLKPYIILNGEPIVYVEVGNSYKELGAIAKDQLGNDITSSIVKTISGTGTTIDTSKVGNKYTITYSVTAEGVTESVNRTVIVNDTTPPILTIPKNTSIYRNASSFDLMTGVSATDNSGEPVDITVKSNISFSIPGEYTVTYTAKDSSGNKTTKNRIIYVLETKDETGPIYASYEVKNITNKGYDVYVYGVSDETGIDRVQFPTWTAYNNQDDLVEDWQSALIVSGTLEEDGTYYFRVNTVDHNGESGTYYTEIHLYDNSGNETVINAIETIVPSITVIIKVNDSTLGKVSTSTVNVGYGAKYTTNGNKVTFPAGQVVTATPVHPAGYTSSFDSWSSTSGTITGDTTITANFTKKANTYKIVYDANDGTGAPSDTTYTYAESGTVTLSNALPTRTGYTFQGWGTSKDDTTVDYHAGGTFNRNVAQDTTLYAIWKLNTYVISYELNGGTGANPTSYNVETATFALTNPTRTGYTFAGWTGSNGTTPSTSVSIVKGSIGDKSYIANWIANSITFNYYANNGNSTSFVTWTATANSTFPDSHWNYTSGTYAQTRTGYTATGYYGTTTTGGTLVHQDESFASYAELCAKYGVNTQTASTTINIYAQWTANTYSITYNANGGSGAPSATTYVYNPDANVSLSGTAPTRIGYAFKGWSLDANATSASYGAGTDWWRGNASNYTLYAVWEKDIITTEIPCTTIGQICPNGTLLNIQVNETTAHDFYVINDTGTVMTLIMSKNIGEKVSWVTKVDYANDSAYGPNGNNNKGPITALKYLNSQTSGWTFIDPITSYTYNNNPNGNTYTFGYQRLTVTNGNAVLTDQIGTTTAIAGITRARLLTYEEASALQTANSGTTPSYLVTNLSADNTTAAPYGYWLSTAAPEKDTDARYVIYSGKLTYTHYVSNETNRGVRPVITVKKS